MVQLKTPPAPGRKHQYPSPYLHFYSVSIIAAPLMWLSTSFSFCSLQLSQVQTKASSLLTECERVYGAIFVLVLLVGYAVLKLFFKMQASRPLCSAFKKKKRKRKMVYMIFVLPNSLNPTSPVVEQIKSIIILPINLECYCGCGAVKR